MQQTQLSLQEPKGLVPKWPSCRISFLFVRRKHGLKNSYIGEIFGKETFPSVTSVQNQHILLLEKDDSVFPQIGRGETQAWGTCEGCCPNTLRFKTEKLPSSKTKGCESPKENRRVGSPFHPLETCNRFQKEALSSELGWARCVKGVWRASLSSMQFLLSCGAFDLSYFTAEWKTWALSLDSHHFPALK